MPSDAAVRVEELGKCYRIASPRAMESGGLAWVRRLCRRRHDFWALRDVSFETAPGEVVGIIGRNGAGKSTLLKILSGITHPTIGRAALRGRVASLLEIGTGFHPDLRARENVYLNGALLGMSRAEIRSKFDAIVHFAEVEEFLDTPVKHFSTGMQMRLAFAVAAHLDGEIMMIDEGLSVGDAAFQAKCAAAMTAARGEGRTVLLVSHNMAVIRSIAQRVLFLEKGRIVDDGAPAEVLGKYLAASETGVQVDVREWENRDGSGEARIESVAILDADGVPANYMLVGGPMHVRFRVRFDERMYEPQFGVRIHSPQGDPLVDLQGAHDGLTVRQVDGAVTVDARVESLWLCAGRYPVSVWVCNRAGGTVDHVRYCASIVVEPAETAERGVTPNSKDGLLYVPSRWCVRKDSCEPGFSPSHVLSA